MIESLAIENLRGIRKLNVSGLTDVNIFIGRNGAGKSTILEAIYLASAFFSKLDPLRDRSKLDYVVERRTGRGSWQRNRDILWYAKNTSEDITIVLKFRTGSTLKFKVLYETPWGEIPLLLEVPEEVARKAGISPPSGSVYLLEKKLVELMGRTIRILSYDYREYDSIVSVLEEEAMYLRGVAFLDSRLDVKSVEQRVWRSILDKRLDKVVVDLIREEYEPSVEGISYKPSGDGFVMSILLPYTSVEIDGLGDGARMAVFYASILALLSDTGVLIEDPEIHQHPGGLVTLLKFTLKMAKEKKLQLFITTHSLELVKIAREISSKYGLDLRVLYVERDHETGLVDVRAMEKVDLEILEKLGLDPRLLHIL
ncbi:MAG: AAA family ATPase [Desulfurococcaceae archaeon]|nr:AAA family ATPase [Desulfurococcaceae archaeon]